MKKILTIGVMGPGANATPDEIKRAEEVGAFIAKMGHYVLTGGSNLGVMNAALKGAKEYDPNARTIAILSHDGSDASKTSAYADVKIPTGMGEGRNYMNTRSCDIIIFCCNEVRLSLGSYSEFCFTIKAKKPAIFFCKDQKIYRTGWFNLLNELCIEDRHEDLVTTSDLSNVMAKLTFMIQRIQNP